jgi:hypothetical protein
LANMYSTVALYTQRSENGEWGWKTR